MMLDDEDAFEAEILGLAHIIDVVAIALAIAALMLANRSAAARTRAAEETESHRLSFSWSGDPTISNDVGRLLFGCCQQQFQCPLDRGAANAAAIAGKHVMLALHLLAFARDAEMHESDRLIRRAAAGAGDTGDSDRQLDRCMGEGAGGHGARDFGADRAMPG